MKTEVDRFTLCLYTLKCADLGHCAKALYLHKEWSRRVLEEFLNQGDHELELGLSISDGMDRRTAELEMSQYRFISSVIQPLYSLYASRFPACSTCLDQITENAAWNKNASEERQRTLSSSSSSP